MRNRGVLIGLLLLAIFLAGSWVTYRLLTRGGEEHTVVESSVLLERVREVCKMVTVEGDFNEIYHEKNIREVTLYLPIPTYWDFSKEALLEVRGTVLVGYNMEQVSFKVDSTAQTIYINNLPTPEILAVDHQITYRNLEESYFNSFTPEDYTQLNKNAKDMLRKKAYESGLLQEAEKNGNAMLSAIEFMAQAIGWKVVYERPLSLPIPTEVRD